MQNVMGRFSNWRRRLFSVRDQATNERLIRECAFFESFNESEAEYLARSCYLRQFKTEQLVYAEGSPSVAMYIVVEGSIGLYQKRRSGQTDRLLLLQPGKFFGDSCLYSDKDRQHSAKALEKSELLVLFKTDFDKISSEYPPVAIKLLKMVALKLDHDLTVFQTEFHELAQKIAQNQLLQ